MRTFTPLSAFALLEITGPDAERFLQGQLTCDVAKLPNQHWLLGACCNAKGRMVANFVIARRDSSFWLRLPSAQVATLTQHLSRYIVFFKASMVAHSHDWQISGSEPLQPPQLLTGAQALTNTELGVVLTWPDGRQERWQPSDSSSTAATPEFWHAADIQHGLVWITPATQLHWLPQEIDWPTHGGVSFTKGCYTGQEIVARLQYLGKSKKQLVRISSTSVLSPAVLAPLLSAGNCVGTVAQWSQQQGLAIINSVDAQSPLQLDDTPIAWASLFYTPPPSE